MHTQFVLALSLAVDAAILPPIAPRAPVPRCEPNYVDMPLVELNDGPTDSGEAGIGAEFESPGIQFQHETCNLADTFEAKRKTIKGRAGTNFLLSADTSLEMGKGKLSAEYILDGRKIKVGDGSARAAGQAVYQDYIAWKPWNEVPPNEAVIQNYPQCPSPWKVYGLSKSTDKDSTPFWFPQITTPMPLEAVYSLMKEIQQYDKNRPNLNILIGNVIGLAGRGDNLKVITKDAFFSLSLIMDTQNVNDAVLGFCSLVISYAKGAAKQVKKGGEETSPKSTITFMPRTEFVTLYSKVKSAFPPDEKLFDIMNILACYKTDKKLSPSIDTEYCSGTWKHPIPGDKFGSLKYNYVGNFPKDGAPQSISIKEWIEKIDTGAAKPDLLTAFDRNFDGSIGGLDKALEKVYRSERTAPLFEFRDLDHLTASGFGTFMTNVDSAVQDLHEKFRSPPTRRMRVKRQDDSSCDLSTSTGSAKATASAGGQTSSVSGASTAIITSPPSIECSVVGPSPGTGVDEGHCDCIVGGSKSLTLSIISDATAYSESCAYTSVPSGSASVSTHTSTWTSNCRACTLVGGVGGGSETCTSVSACTPTTAVASSKPTSTTADASPTIVAWVANVGTIDIGNAEDGGDGGKGLATDMFNKLSKMCDKKGCKADHQEMDNVEAVLAGGEEPLKPAMYIDGAVYQDLDSFRQMLAVGLSSWISALENKGLKLCQDVEYEADADSTGSGCGTGPIPTDRIRRKLRRDNGTVLWERNDVAVERRGLEERCLDNCDRPEVCHYKARMCQAPDSITVVSSTKDSSYGNHLNIGVTLDKTGDGFDCEAIVGGLTAAMAILAPELIEVDAMEGVELEALCGIIDDPSSALDSLVPGSTERVTVSRRQR